MSADIINESILWMSCFFAGIVITIVYDLVLVFRRIIEHKYFFVALEDILFWIFVSVTLFLLLYHMNKGAIRWFAVFGLFVGMYLYKKVFGETLVIFMSTIIGHILHVVVAVTSPPLKLVKAAYLQCLRLLKEAVLQGKKKLTGNIKSVKIILCKHKNRKKRETNESEHTS